MHHNFQVVELDVCLLYVRRPQHGFDPRVAVVARLLAKLHSVCEPPNRAHTGQSGVESAVCATHARGLQVGTQYPSFSTPCSKAKMLHRMLHILAAARPSTVTIFSIAGVRPPIIADKLGSPHTES